MLARLHSILVVCAQRGSSALAGTVIVAAIVLCSSAEALAQPKTPAPPAKFSAKVRYKIDTTGLKHVDQFDEMVAGLKKLGFEFVPSLAELPNTIREDQKKNVLTGKIAGTQAYKIGNVPFIASVQLTPETFNVPKDPAQRVQVQLELPYHLPASKQLELLDQVRSLLFVFGFEEMAGYDHHGVTGKAHTRLRGTIPAEHLDALLKDVRRAPTGWLAPVIASDKLPEPFRSVNPILFSTIMADPMPVKPTPYPASRGEADFEKIDAKLWELVKADKPHKDDLRIEIILSATPKSDSTLWQIALQKAAPRLIVEGSLGQVVTGMFPGAHMDEKGNVVDSLVKDDFKQIKALATLPFVSVVRLPRSGLTLVDPAMGFKGNNALALVKSGVGDLHKKGYKGKGVRLAILDGDFRGWQEALDQGKLPKDTLYIDLTRERNYDLAPDPVAGPLDQLGHGTHCALAAVTASPEAKVVLVRIDPTSPPMIKTAVGYIYGDFVLSPDLARRHDDLIFAKAKLQKFRDEVATDKKIVLATHDDDTDLKDKFGFLGPVGAWVFLPRDWMLKRDAELEQAEKAHVQKQAAMSKFVAEVKQLQGVEVITCQLGWADGYPLGTRSPLTKWLDDKLRPNYVYTAAGKKVHKGPQKPLWFQPAGNTRGQSWQGLYQDIDRNGAMEFAGFAAKLPPGSWTPELNFLAWQPYQGKQTLDLPENTRFRLSLQWTEPHDPAYFFRPDEKDYYLKPLADLQVIVLRQRDPEATALSEDDFEEVARSFMLPQRLDNYPDSATCELYVEWTTTKPGRYCVRVEKMLPTRWLVVPDKETGGLAFTQLTDLVPTGILPLEAPSLPKIEKKWELQPRLFVQAVEGAAAGLGRPVFRDFSTGLGDVGVAADGRVLVSVGAADGDGKSESFSAAGPPSHMELALFPTALSFDRLDIDLGGKKGPAFGTSLSAAFAAGSAAAILSSGTPADEFLLFVQQMRKKKTEK